MRIWCSLVDPVRDTKIGSSLHQWWWSLTDSTLLGGVLSELPLSGGRKRVGLTPMVHTGFCPELAPGAG